MQSDELEYKVQHTEDDTPSIHRSMLSELSTKVRRVAEVLVQGAVALIVRFSTPGQKVNNRGSLDFQLRQIAYLEPYGVREPDVERYISAESAAGQDTRPDFERLMRRIESGHVRFVVAAFADRVARNWEHFHRMAEALKRVRGLIMLEGEIFDLADLRGEFDFRTAANLAVLQSGQRIQKGLVHRCAKARRLALKYRLPVGYCWESIEDPYYIQQLDAHGMRAAIGNAPEGDLTNVHYRGRRLLVLPVPDAEIYQSMQLRRDVLLQERDIRPVLEMMHSDSAWPRQHHYPVLSQEKGPSNLPVIEWADLRNFKTSSKSVMARAIIGRWFASPTLYGIYAWQLADSTDLDDHLKLFGARVWVPNAIPHSLFRPEHRAIVGEVLKQRSQFRWYGGADISPDPKPVDSRGSVMTRFGLEAVLPEVRCSELGRDGEACAIKMIAGTDESKAANERFAYNASSCRGRHPLAGGLTLEAEQLIIQIVLEHLSPKLIRDAVAHIELKTSVERSRTVGLRRDLAQLDAHLAFLRHSIARAHADRGVGLAKQLMLGLSEAGERRHRLSCDLADAEAGLATEEALTDADRARILTLAERLPELWTRAAMVPGTRSALMKTLIRRVHVRRVARRIDYVEIEFPSGARIARLICVTPVQMSRAWRRWCLDRVRHQLVGDRMLRLSVEDMAEANRVAEELTTLYPHPYRDSPWRGDDIRAAAILETYEVKTPDILAPIGEAVEEIAQRTNIPLTEMRTAAAKDRLGASTFFDGIVRYLATDAVLCKAFLAFARRNAAAANSWTEEDTIPLGEAAKTYGVHPSVLFRANYTERLAIGHDASGFAWVRRSDVEALTVPTFDEVLASLADPAITADDFVPIQAAHTIFERMRGRALANGWVYTAAVAGYVRLLHARRPGTLSQLAVWVYLPTEIRESTDMRLVNEWLEGLRPELTPWSPKRKRRPLLRQRGAARATSSDAPTPKNDATDGDRRRKGRVPGTDGRRRRDE